MVYGLEAMGEEGVLKALQFIHKELDITMAFCGHTNIQNVATNILLPGTYDFNGQYGRLVADLNLEHI